MISGAMVNDPHVMPVFIDLASENPAQLYQKMIDAICQFHLYTDVQLQALYEQALQQNGQT